MTAVYEWYQQGLALIKAGDNHAAVTVLERAAAAESDKGSIREALARAYFGTGRFDAALGEFEAALEISPVNDYAHFGAGLCLARVGRLPEAVGHLRMANVMRPGNADYEAALARYESWRRLRPAANSSAGWSEATPSDE
jgi:tetratricopeptide (TPR) repeat protein